MEKDDALLDVDHLRRQLKDANGTERRLHKEFDEGREELATLQNCRREFVEGNPRDLVLDDRHIVGKDTAVNTAAVRRRARQQVSQARLDERLFARRPSLCPV